MLDFIVGSSFLSSIIAFGLVLIPAIVIHELGHFLAAKMVGITVLEFGVGFPPRMARLFMWGETEFTLNWLPLGGFVRPLGEDLVRPLNEEEVERDRAKLKARQDLITEDRQITPPAESQGYLSEREELKRRGYTRVQAVHETKPLPRIFFMVAGALANFLTAFILFIVIGLIGVPQTIGARIQFAEVPPGSNLAEAGIQNGDLVETINGELFVDEQDWFRILRKNTGKPVTLSILRLANDREEVSEDDIVSLNIDIVPIDQSIQGAIRILSVFEESPADQAGILPDDLIVGLNGEQLQGDSNPVLAIQEAAHTFAGRELTLDIIRDGESLTLSLIPNENPIDGQTFIGIGIGPEYIADDGVIYAVAAPQQELVPQPLGLSISYGVERTLETLRLIGEIPARLIQGTITAEEARPVSIIGISQVGGQFLQESIENDRPTVILNFMALISLFLGITNLLPIPAMDGGRILFVLIEMVRGRPISPEREGLVHLIGIVFLLSLGVVIMLYDIINPFVLPSP